MIAMLCKPGPADEGTEAKPHCWPGRQTFSQHQPLMPSHGGWGGHSGASGKNRSDAWVINKRIDTSVRFGKHQGWLAERWREELLFMRSKLACSEPLKQTKTMQTSCLYAIYIACSTVQCQHCSHRQWRQQKNSHVDKRRHGTALGGGAGGCPGRGACGAQPPTCEGAGALRKVAADPKRSCRAGIKIRGKKRKKGVPAPANTTLTCPELSRATVGRATDSCGLCQ